MRHTRVKHPGIANPFYPSAGSTFHLSPHGARLQKHSLNKPIIATPKRTAKKEWEGGLEGVSARLDQNQPGNAAFERAWQMNDQRAQGLKQGSAFEEKVAYKTYNPEGAKVWRKPEGLPWTGNPYSTPSIAKGGKRLRREPLDSWLGINASLLLASLFLKRAPRSRLYFGSALCRGCHMPGVKLSGPQRSPSPTRRVTLSLVLFPPASFSGPPFSSAPLSSLFPMLCACVLLPPAFCLDLQSSLCSLSGHTLSSWLEEMIIPTSRLQLFTVVSPPVNHGLSPPFPL